MLDRVGLSRGDGRNLLIVALIMAVVIAATTPEPLVVRAVAGVVGGIVAGTAFLVVTLLINRFKPDHW